MVRLPATRSSWPWEWAHASEWIAMVMVLLAADGTAQSRFKSIIDSRGYRASDAPHYTTRFEQRTQTLKLIPVGESFPAVTRMLLEEAFGS